MVGGFAGVSGRSSARDISPRADWSQLEGVIREREGGMTSEEGLERSSIGADGRAVGKGGDMARRGYDRRKALVALEAVVGCPGASWRSREQEEMVRLALERVENFIVVLPTGGGKSLAWEVPLLVERGEGGMNVLFSAFVTLSEDIRRRTTSHGVKAVMWGKVAGRGMGGETPELVIAAPDLIAVLQNSLTCQGNRFAKRPRYARGAKLALSAGLLSNRSTIHFRLRHMLLAYRKRYIPSSWALLATISLKCWLTPPLYPYLALRLLNDISHHATRLRSVAATCGSSWFLAGA